VNVNHFIIAKMFEEELNSPLKRKMEKQFGKKRSNPCGNAIVNFLTTNILSIITTRKLGS
jgi:hypothetical protein